VFNFSFYLWFAVCRSFFALCCGARQLWSRHEKADLCTAPSGSAQIVAPRSIEGHVVAVSCGLLYCTLPSASTFESMATAHHASKVTVRSEKSERTLTCSCPLQAAARCLHHQQSLDNRGNSASWQLRAIHSGTSSRSGYGQGPWTWKSD
jgi:hypothetical protein